MAIEIDDFQRCWEEIEHEIRVIAVSRFRLQEADCEDVVQAVAVLALRRLERVGFNDMAHAKRWAVRAAGHRCIDKLRAFQALSLGDSAGLLCDQRASTQKAIDDLRLEIDVMLRDLPPRQQQVLRQDLAGRSTTEIASEMGISAGGVRSLRRFGMAFLRRRIQEMNHD